jgi:hypothetical protein
MKRSEGDGNNAPADGNENGDENNGEGNENGEKKEQVFKNWKMSAFHQISSRRVVDHPDAAVAVVVDDSVVAVTVTVDQPPVDPAMKEAEVKNQKEVKQQTQPMVVVVGVVVVVVAQQALVSAVALDEVKKSYFVKNKLKIRPSSSRWRQWQITTGVGSPGRRWRRKPASRRGQLMGSDVP